LAKPPDQKQTSKHLSGEMDILDGSTEERSNTKRNEQKKEHQRLDELPLGSKASTTDRRKTGGGKE